MSFDEPTWEELSRFADHYERGQLLLEYADGLSAGDYWRAVGDAWGDSERQALTPADWRGLWLHGPPGREQVMTVEERDELAALPDRVTVYRGINHVNHRAGLSWTLDRDLAHWFALWGGLRSASGDYGRAVVGGTILRHRILALRQERQEHEIVAQPRHVYARSWERPDPDRAQRAIEARQRASEGLPNGGA